MKTKQMKIYQSLVFVSCLLAASWVQAATYAITFFDQNNSKVGQGQFTTDPNEIYTFTSDDQAAIQGCLGSGQTLRECGLERDYSNLVTKFSATIQGEPWGFETTGPTWWAAQGQMPGELRLLRGGSILQDGGWFLGDAFFGERYLGMGFNEANALSGTGVWEQVVNDFSVSGPPRTVGEGTFTVAATPIPAAVWLFASGLGALGVFRRKKAQS